MCGTDGNKVLCYKTSDVTHTDPHILSLIKWRLWPWVIKTPFQWSWLKTEQRRSSPKDGRSQPSLLFYSPSLLRPSVSVCFSLCFNLFQHPCPLLCSVHFPRYSPPLSQKLAFLVFNPIFKPKLSLCMCVCARLCVCLCVCITEGNVSSISV